jgi:hypothetical protein
MSYGLEKKPVESYWPLENCLFWCSAQQKPVSYSRSLSHYLHVRARNGDTATSSSHGDMYRAPGEGGCREEFHPRGKEKKNKDRELAARIYAARSSGSGSTE